MTILRKVIAFIAMGSFASALCAADVLWTGSGDGATWNSAANWNPQRVPTAEDAAIFEKAATLTGTVNVLGRMTVRNGAAVTATDTVLGGSAGASAYLLVTGSGSSFRSDKVTIGCADGGSGKMVAENGGSVFIDNKDKDGLVVANGAQPAAGDVLDVLEIGDSTSRVVKFGNKSAYLARVRFMSATSRLELNSKDNRSWLVPFDSTESWKWVFAADAPAAVNVYVGKDSNFTKWCFLTVEGTGAFNLSIRGTAAPYYCYLNLLNKGGFSLAKGAPLNFNTVTMQEMLGQLTVASALNVNGTAVFADGLMVASTGSLMATADGSFTFGTGDRDGVLSAAIPVVAPVTKVGAGTLTVTGASSAGDFVLSGGTLKVTAATSLSSLTMEAGTTLVVDGADLTLGNLVQHGSVTVTTVNGGRILYGGSAMTELLRPALGDDFVKVGSAKTTIFEPISVPASLHVSEGELAFSKYGLAQRYWKWTFKGVVGGPKAQGSLGKIWLFGADGSRVGEGIEKAGSKWEYYNIDLTTSDDHKGKATWLCDPSTSIAAATGNSWEDPYGKMIEMFRFSGNVNGFPRLGSPVIDKTNPASYLGLEVRFRDTDGPISGYTFGYARNDGRPTDWTLEVSDDGKAWTTVDERSDVPSPSGDTGVFCDGTTYATVEPNPPPAESFHIMGYLREGLTPSATALSVQVDGDAKLNLKAFTGGQSVGALTYDAALGAGEIENAVFAANGTLYYTSASGKPARGTVLPYVLTNCSGLENLANWSVVINGKATAWRVSIQNGLPTLIPPGLIIVVQ